MLDADVEFKLGEFTLSPKNVQSEVLKKLVRIAESHLGEGEVGEAVITVPAYFQNAQRALTTESGSLAGLQVKKILLEPAGLHFSCRRSRRGPISPKTPSQWCDLGGL